MAKLKLGVIVGMSAQESPREAIKTAGDLGLPTCQLTSWTPECFTDEMASAVAEACEEFDVEVSTFWSGYSGEMVWNFVEGPATIGLVPPGMRAQRVADLKKGAEFAKKLGVGSITTHVGFLPINANDADYVGTVDALREVAGYCNDLGLGFNFETGQETPVTLLRCMEDVGTGNLGINLDPANLILYGMANPVDALDVFGKHVRGVHAKDGVYPTNGRELGAEAALGQGKVDFPTLIGRLKDEFGYAGPITIEREISGEQQIKDIRSAIEILDKLC